MDQSNVARRDGLHGARSARNVPAGPPSGRWLARLAIVGLVLVSLIGSGDSPPAISAQTQSDEPSPPSELTTPDGDAGLRRVLLEAERFVDSAGGAGWRPIAVGEGNYMVDAIGASHVSGGRLLHADAASIGATAHAGLTAPGDGRYKLWVRYEYPYRSYAVPFEVTVEQAGAVALRMTYGRRDATRMWFFRRPDAPWQDFENGVEGLVAEAYPLDLRAGPATVSLRVVGADGDGADRNIDALFLTDDLGDTFRGRGERLYPMLDEFGRAATGRTWIRLTNPAESGRSVEYSAQYTINRAPWRQATVRIGHGGLVGRGASQPLAPGEQTPWLDLSCIDTTHDCHLQLTSQGARDMAVTVEVAGAPDESAVLRRLDYAELEGDRLLLNVPPYPTEEPWRILTGEEVLEGLLARLEASPPPADGRPPARFLVYATMGDGWETGLDRRTRIAELSRRLFGVLGPSAPTILRASQAGPARELMQRLGRETPPSFVYGRYRWFPSDEAIAEAEHDLDAVDARPLLRGFTFGDEVKLDEWLPKDGRDEAFRAWLQGQGADPRQYLPPDASGHGTSDDPWQQVRLDPDAARARHNPRVYIDSRRFLEAWAVERLAAQAEKLRARFGDDVIFGANYSPGAYFWPMTTQWVRLFQQGGANRASHDDYWWQVSEMGPESTGYLIDAFRAGLRGARGTIQPYVMPHSPGNTDRDFLLGLATALIHGASALDLFNLGPEQSGTENYVSSRDPERLRTVRDALYQLGAVEDLLLDGTRRPARVGLVLSESTERWELATPGQYPLLSPGLQMPSLVYAQERKFLWEALRHAQVLTETLVEADLVNGAATAYDVIYLPASHLAPDAAAALARWVDAGGTLVSVAGGGLRDPYDRPLDTLLPVYGLRGADLERGDTFFRPRIEVPRLIPRDHVRVELTTGAFDLPVLGMLQRLDPLEDSTVLGRFADGAPAIVEHAYGRGRAVIIGTLPGVAYFQSAFPTPPPVPDRGPGQHTPLTAFRADIRDVIASWAAAIPRDWPVSSDPLVEVGQWETADSLLLVVANSGAAPTRTRIWAPGVGPIEAAIQLGRGPLAFEQAGADVSFDLELNVVEYIRLTRQPLSRPE